MHEPEAAKLLALKPSTLKNMRREHRLDAGTHWVYATGSIGGPVVYNILKIREMQIQRTSDAVEKEDVQRNSRPSQHAKTQRRKPIARIKRP